MTDTINVADLVRYDPARNCFVLRGTNVKQTCNCLPDSPFHWAHNPRPSIFFNDLQFRAKGISEKSTAQLATESVDRRRANGEMVNYMHGIGEHTVEKEKRLLAYKQFGIYSKAGPSLKKPNKHEAA